MINIKHPKTRGKPPVNRPNAVQEKADCNQNVECSFEQLCNMINDLEKNIVNEMPEVENHLQLKPEKDNSDRTCGGNGTTYDDIMSFLTKFEETGTLE